VLKPARVFDGVSDKTHDGWVVVVEGDRITGFGAPADVKAPANAVTVDLPGMTLLPGLIEAHSHVMLHPYDEASWDDQVSKEPLALRTARATVSLRRTLEAGFTTIRDLGTEGAGSRTSG
jgi:imidazolonepropionase-like amidohydrolase